MTAEVLASGADLVYNTNSLISQTGFQQRLRLRLLEMMDNAREALEAFRWNQCGILGNKLFGCTSKRRVGALTMNKSQTEQP
jgi:hypothetical protein